MSMEMEKLLQDFVRSGEAAGVSALVYKDGKEAYFGSCGEADKDRHTPFTRDTVVRIYSMTKIVTAVTALACMEQGLFRLDDPIARYIPEFSYTKIAVVDAMEDLRFIDNPTPITFRHLFTMTSGIPYPEKVGNAAMTAVMRSYSSMYDRYDQSEKEGRAWSAQQFARELAHCPLCFEPGTRWKYGLSMDVLGGLIEAMTGSSLYEVMRKTVFDKLDMQNTIFVPSWHQNGQLASVYTHNDQDQLVAVDVADYDSMQYGGSGLYTTIDDYMRFARMLLGGGMLGGVRVLQEKTLREMTRAQVNLIRVPGYDWDSEPGYGYGLGVRVMERPEESAYDESIGAFGWNGMAGTSMRVSPRDNTAAVFFVQHIPPKHEVFLPPFAKAVKNI